MLMKDLPEPFKEICTKEWERYVETPITDVSQVMSLNWSVSAKYLGIPRDVFVYLNKGTIVNIHHACRLLYESQAFDLNNKLDLCKSALKTLKGGISSQK